MKHFTHKTTLHRKCRSQLKKKAIEQHLLNFPSSSLLKQFCLSLLFCLGLLTNSFAQETWTGAIDTDWTKNGNWLDNTAPFNGTIGGVLTIQGGAPHEPTSNVPATITAVQLVVMSPFTIPSTSTVEIDNTTGVGDGVITSLSGANLTVYGILNVNNAHDNGLEIGQDGTKLLNLGTISVNNSNAAGLFLTGSGSSVNNGNLTINHSGTNGIFLIDNAVPFNSFDNQNCLVINNSGSDAINNKTFFENSNKLTIDIANGNGINNGGFFTNDSLATLTINKVSGNGITTERVFVNNGGNITIGNGNLGDIGSNGINVAAGVFVNNSTTSQGGGIITVNGVAGSGLNIAGILENGSIVAGDSLGIITIDNVNGNGINLSGTFTNQASSKLAIGENGGNIRGFGVAGTGTIMNANSTIIINGTAGSFDLTSLVTNTGDCGLLEITGPTDFMGGLTNNAIIISSAPANSVTVAGGPFINNGIIIDPNNSLGISDRATTPGITNDGGVIIIPDSMMCYTDTIESYLITGSTRIDTLPYLPASTFTMTTNPNAAVLDTANNRLVLNAVQSLMNFNFDILFNGVSCGVTGTTSLFFENLPNNFLACSGNLQVTLISDCQAILKPSDLLRGNIVCNDGYKIGIIGSTMGDSLILDASQIGQTVNVMVTNPLGNSCWSSLTIEDKTAPVCQDGRDTSYFCGRSFDPLVINTYPIVVDACGTVTDTTYRDSIITLPDCGVNPADIDTIRRIIRTWTFRDASGNSTTCVQNLYELKPTLDMVQFPANLTGASALSCEDGSYFGRTGYPFVEFQGDTILVNEICKFGIDTLDYVVNINCPGEQRITRTWKVTDWCAPLSTNPVRRIEQLIDVVDTLAPTFTLVNTAIITGNADHTCAANVVLPAVTDIVDGCSAPSDVSVTIIGPSNTIFANGGTMPNVPFGTHNVIYIVADGCGNERRDTISVTVNDILSPVAVGIQASVTLIDTEVITWVYGSSFDGGSHDNCGVDSFLVRKSYVDTFATKVGFSCADIGLSTIMIKVVDTAGNSNIAWTLVKVEDKLNKCMHDNDGASNRCEDLNGDGDLTNDFTLASNASIPLPDYLNPDDDGDGVLTIFENPDPNGDGDCSDAQDTDGDGIPDFKDIDDDNDGIWTVFEFISEDNDEITVATALDTNNDGVPNFLDKDDDGDSVFTIYEGANPVNGNPTSSQDTDGDKIPDFLDDNDDGDGIATRFESPDANNDGNPDDAKNTDNTGAPDYLDPFQNFTSFATVAGHIQNENGELVESVNITMGGYEMVPEITGANGTFSFEEIPLNGDYRITPEKDMNYGNGITTFDIVLLSKHVLGLKPLDSPYKMIAADINHSGSISAYDMVLLRQVILGMKNDFPNNTSWRFIDADYEFFNPENPFIENYPEAYEITNLAGDMMTLDFTAVKIGDLNNSASANQFMMAESRKTTTALNFEIAEQVKEMGEVVIVDFKSSNFQSILGYQFEVDFDGNALAFEQLLIGDKMGFENFNLSMIERGMITTSWNQAEAVNLAADEILFSLVFRAKENLRISETIKIGSDITSAEAYTGMEEVINVNLDILTSTSSIAGFKLYQNKPNPFTGATVIGFDLPTAAATTMTIFDMSGKVVKVIAGEYEKGYNQIVIDGKAFNDYGMFYYQLATQNGIETKKMILLK